MAVSHRVKQEGWKARTAVPPRAVYFWIGFSAFCHLFLLAAMVLVPEMAPARKLTGSIVNVSLVALPSRGQPQPPARKTTVKTEKKTAPTVSSSKTTKKAPKMAAKRAPKKSLKRKTYNSTKVVKSAVAELEKKVEETRPASLDQALDRLKTEVDQTEVNPRQVETPPVTSEMQGAGGTATTGLPGAETSDRIRIYQAEIAYQIQKNWAFSEQMAGMRDELEAALAITILPNGQIKDIWFDKRSGNRHLDESAHRAIKKSDPLPPLPVGLFKTEYTVGLLFGPKGIK